MWYRFAAPPSILVKNPYPNGFWVGDRFIKPGEEMGIVAWRELLKTTLLNVRNENNLLAFLNTRIIKDNRNRNVFQFFIPATLLANPVVGGFWVNEKKKNELDQDISIPRFIAYGQKLGVVEWKKLLSTDRIKINSEDKLRDFLSNNRFQYIGKKKFYIPLVSGNPTLLANPIVGGFWVNEKKKNESGQIPIFIAYMEKKGVTEWNKLLNTSMINSEDKDSLKKFLNNERFEYVGERKFYKPAPLNKAVMIKNPISEGFYVGEDFIEPNDEKNIREWTRLLRSDVLNIKDMTLEQFLSDKLIRNEEGNLIYTYDPRRRSTLFKNPISEGFYVGEDFIEPSRTMGVVEWMKLLNTSYIKASDKNSLRDFLNQDGKLTEIDGKKIYNPFVKVKYLKNPIKEGFWVGKRFVRPDEELNISEWQALLKTDRPNVSNDENLLDFLSDRRRWDTFNNKKTYVPKKKSKREGLFGEKFNKYNRDDIIVKNGQYIIVMTNKTNILYLDFAFVKNGKILLAIEINGSQHYGFVSFSENNSYKDWQNGLERDILKINYCHDNNIPLLIFHHMLSLSEFKTILNNLYENPNAYAEYIPQPVIDKNVKNTSLEFIKRQIYSHLYPVFNGTITFENDESKKRYIKDTLILISKLMGIYEGGIDKTDYVKSFDLSTDLTDNYNKCLAIYNSLYPHYPLEKDEKITYLDLSKKPRLFKEKLNTNPKTKAPRLQIEKPSVIGPAEEKIPTEDWNKL